MTRRLPTGLIVGGVAAILVVVAGAGAAFASILSANDDPPLVPTLAPASSTPAVATPVSTPGPTTAPSSPIVTPSPVPSGSGSTATQVVEVENIALELPSDWTVENQKPTLIVVQEPDTYGLVILESLSTASELTIEAYQQQIVTEFEGWFTDTALCESGDPKPAPVPGGPQDGVALALCYTVTPENGQAYPAVSLLILGVQGKATFFMEFYAHKDYLSAFWEEAGQLGVPLWKLYTP